MKITIIDGQGGRMGKAIVEQLKKQHPELELYAIGTNSIATAAMLKAGADFGATGENPVIRAVRDADVVLGPMGIVVANAILGEVTPAMAQAVGDSPAQKILIPMNGCGVQVAGVEELPLGAYAARAVERAAAVLEQGR